MSRTHAMKPLAAFGGAVTAIAAVALIAPGLTSAAGSGPTIPCPAPITAEATGNFAASVNVPTATATGDGVVVTGPSGTNTYPLGTTAIAFTATDSAGDSASCASSVTVVDTTPPVITCPAPITAEATGSQSASVNVPGATATDIGTSATVSGPSGTNTFLLGTTVITFTATDQVGNTASCQTSVTVVPVTLPTITCPAPITAEATGNAAAVVSPGAAVGSDPDGPVTITGPVAGSYPLGTTVVTYTATDIFGNTATCTGTITVAATTAPATPCRAPIPAEATGNQSAPVNVPGAAAADIGTSATVSGPSGTNAFPLGTTTITFTATDVVGNTSSCATSVTVVDTTKPTITCPSDISVTSGSSGTAVVTYAASASDTDGSVSIGYSQPPGSTFAIGTTTVTATAMDIVGNTASCTFTVAVQRVTPTSLCELTKQYGESSAKFHALTNAQKAAVDALANALCAKLAQIVPTLTPTQTAALVSAYKAGVQALVPLGWLTQSQANELKSLADTL